MRPAAPAGADLEHVVGGLEVELAAEGVVLGASGPSRAWRRAGPLGAGIHHRRVEPEGEEVVGEIVVVADVAAGGGAGVGAEQVAEAVGGAEEVERERFACCEPESVGACSRLRMNQPMSGGEVGRLPIAIDVGLGETDVAVEHAFFEEGRRRTRMYAVLLTPGASGSRGRAGCHRIRARCHRAARCGAGRASCRRRRSGRRRGRRRARAQW